MKFAIGLLKLQIRGDFLLEIRANRGSVKDLT